MISALTAGVPQTSEFRRRKLTHAFMLVRYRHLAGKSIRTQFHQTRRYIYMDECSNVGTI